MKKLFITVVCVIMGMMTQTKAQNFSLQLDGINDYVNISTAADNVRTIEMWFRPTTNINSSLLNPIYLMGRNVAAPNIGRFYLGFSASAGHQGELVFFSKHSTAGSNTAYSGINNWTAGTWYHVTVVIHPSSGTQLYINGVAAGSSAAAGIGALEIKTEITAIGRYGSSASNYFSGRIENVRLWNYALNPLSEIIPNQCNTPLTTVGLRAEYLFNEGIGVTANDFMVAFPGVVNGGATWAIDCPCNIVMQFDGVDDNINLGPDVGDNVRSIEMWFRPRTTINAASPISSLIVRNDLGELEEFGLYFSGGRLFFFARLANNLQQVPSLFATFNANIWYHVVATIEAPATPGGIHAGMNLYINGVFQGNNPARNVAITAQPEITTLGDWGGDPIGRFFDGQIENVRLWSRALIQNPALPIDEPLNNMCNLPLNYTGIIAEYRLNEHHGNVVTDQFGAAVDGIVGGGVTQPVRRWVEGQPCNFGSGLDRLANTETVNNADESEMKIYPNPNAGTFSVSANTDENFLVEIYDITGKKVKSMESHYQNIVSIDLSNEQKGVYFVRMINGNQLISKKVMIQ